MARSAEQSTGLFRSLRHLRAGAPARLAACPTSIGTTLVFQSRIEGMGIQHGVHTAADISELGVVAGLNTVVAMSWPIS